MQYWKIFSPKNCFQSKLFWNNRFWIINVLIDLFKIYMTVQFSSIKFKMQFFFSYYLKNVFTITKQNDSKGMKDLNSLFYEYIVCSTSIPNATLTSCPFFFTRFWVGLLLLCCCTHPKVSEKKWATGQSCIRKRSTT